MTQEQIVDREILELLDVKAPGSKGLIETHTNKSNRREKMLSILDDDRSLFKQYKNIIRSEEVCGNYAKEVVQLLREYVKVADIEKEEHGEVMTPIILVNEVLDKLPSEVWLNPNLKWLDPCNGVGTFPSVVVERLMIGLKDVIVDDCERYRHIIEKMVYVCEIQSKNMFLFHCAFDREDDHELNTYYGSFLDKGFDEHMLNVWGVEKFDIVMGNPPFMSGLHHHFTIKSIEILKGDGTLLFVQPAMVYINRKPTKKENVEIKLINYVNEYETELDLFRGYDYFDIRIQVPVSITKIIKRNSETITIKNRFVDPTNPTSEIVDNVNKLHIHGNGIVRSIKNKIETKLQLSVHDKLYKESESDYYLVISKMAGYSLKKGRLDPRMYTIITRAYENNYEHLITTDKESSKIGQLICLNSYDECVNTSRYLLTKFARFCLSIYKNGANLNSGELKLVPFIDPTIQWSDEMLFQHFELTQEEINFINEFIGDWYQRDFQNN